MFDLIIRGGDVVTPQGVVRCDVAVAGETIAAIAAAGALSAESATRVIDATGHIVMPGGIDPHVHLHHVWIKPDGTPLVTAGPEQVGRAALFGGTTTFIDFAYWRDGASARQAIETRDKDFVGKEPVRLGLSHHAALRAAARILRAARGGDPGRLSDAQDIHHQHPPVAQRPHDRFRRHLGGVPGAGERGRARRHPCGRQRHRHAHVRQAHPREPRRFRASRRSPQPAVGGLELSPHPAARRKRARHRALHDARFRRHRRRRDRRGARAKGCRSTARRCISICSIRRTTTNAPTARSITPIRRSSRRRTRRRCGTARRTTRSTASPPTSCAARSRTRPSATGSTTPPAAIRASSRGSASCTPRWSRAAAIRSRNTSIWFRPMPPRSWASIREKARSRPAATPTSRSSIRPGAARCAPPTCTRPTTRRGKATTSSPGRW